jgi:predicted transcriptional regulator
MTDDRMKLWREEGFKNYVIEYLREKEKKTVENNRLTNRQAQNIWKRMYSNSVRKNNKIRRCEKILFHPEVT